MSRSLNVLSKILGLTASVNAHEAKAAEAKLEQQLEARGISREDLEKSLDMQTVEEDIEVMSFRYGTPYKRVDPAVSIILGAVAEFYNGKIVFTPYKMERSGNKKHQKEYIRDSKGDIYRQMEVTANKARKIEIEIYTDYLLQSLNDDWAKHCKEDPFKVAIEGASYRNSFRKAWARKVDERFSKMKKDEETNGRQLQLTSKTVNQSALVVTKANQTELAKVEEFYAERYPSIGKGGSGYTGGGSGSSAGSSAGSSVGLNRQVSGGGQKQLSGY